MKTILFVDRYYSRLSEADPAYKFRKGRNQFFWMVREQLRQDYLTHSSFNLTPRHGQLFAPPSFIRRTGFSDLVQMDPRWEEENPGFAKIDFFVTHFPYDESSASYGVYGMSLEVIREVRETLPWLPIVIVTGALPEEIQAVRELSNSLISKSAGPRETARDILAELKKF